MQDNLKLLDDMFDKYNIKDEDRYELINIIKPIYLHPEFQKRLGVDFPHHGKISVGEHIIEDTIKTYLLSKIYINKKKKDYDINVALYISLFHDLYTLPWQNNKDAKVNKFINLHGFRHPVEAVINAYTWYPEVFTKDNTLKIIDGIIHHMYPLPVVVFNSDSDNKRELKNYKLYKNLPDYIEKAIIDSTHRSVIGSFSITKSKYMEGRIMSKADKYVSIRQIKNVYDLFSLVSGKNKNLNK